MPEIKLILCPIDFSEFSIRAYHRSLSVAGHYGSKLVALHIVELSHYPYADFAAAEGDYEAFCQSLQKGGKEQLQTFVKNHGNDEVQPELVVQQGVAADCILSFAQERKADVIVMGSHGRRGYDRLVLGSATDRVMRRSPCPVLAVRNPPHESAEAPAGEERRHFYRLNRILFCTDFSENSERALNYAISVTEEYDAELTLLHVLEEASSGARTEQAMAAATAQLDKRIPPEVRKKLRINTAVRVGKPYEQIIRFAEEAENDLVTMGVRGRGTLDVAVFGSTTYRVIQLGPCPVLAVRV